MKPHEGALCWSTQDDVGSAADNCHSFDGTRKKRNRLTAGVPRLADAPEANARLSALTRQRESLDAERDQGMGRQCAIKPPKVVIAAVANRTGREQKVVLDYGLWKNMRVTLFACSDAPAIDALRAQ